MRKIYFIIAGIITILILVLVWVYLLIYGTPKPVEKFFTDFSLTGNTISTGFAEVAETSTQPQVDVQKDRLRQLTVKPVIGFKEVSIGDERLLYYSEAGTGHIYTINLATGEEKRVSNSTVVNASQAEFNNNGTFAVIRSGYTLTNNVQLLTINGDTINNSSLPIRMIDYTWNSQNKLYYTDFSDNGLVAHTLDPNTLSSQDIFTVPFPSATVIWSNTTTTPHYVFSKTSSKLMGYLYSISNTRIRRLPIAGVGLTVLANKKYIVSTKQVNNQPVTNILNLNTGKSVLSSIIAEPKKCTLSDSDTNIMYCGNEQSKYGSDFPDDWYRGEKTFSDRIWSIDLARGSATQIENPENTIGRTFDVTNMSINIAGGVLYFMNKNDNTLWMYEI